MCNLLHFTKPKTNHERPIAKKKGAPLKPNALKLTPSLSQSALHTVALAALDDAKAEEIVTIDLTGKTSLADTMIVASGRSQRHVGAVADQLIEKLKGEGVCGTRVEGMELCDWVLVDAGDVIVHIFRPEVRAFYNLEKMWASDRPQLTAAE